VNLKLRTPPEIVEKVLHLRRTYRLGPICIVWCLERYHGIKISDAHRPHGAFAGKSPYEALRERLG
jgi:hypothetical protein